MRNIFTKIFFTLTFFLFISTSFAQQTKVKKSILQAFWWDYWNNNFTYGWSNYLCELAPRLKALGFDAIWIPPVQKNASGGYVGYSPFDQYDLGDKYQKGSDAIRAKTRSGTKDDLLRMIAVMHANGIEIIEDLVLNHNADAGTNTGGTGGLDNTSAYSTASAAGYKNFRYVSYKTPLLDESLNDYYTRSGRWQKNYQNFHPNAANNCNSGDICSTFWGPDIDYETAGAFGQSGIIPTSGSVVVSGVTRSYYNPAQTSSYMLNSGRSWIMWFKKQTGVDGWRMDAVKHYSLAAQTDYIYNTKYNLPAWAKGGETMTCFGEWVSGSTDEDAYVNNVKNGAEELTGTIDFSLRGYGTNGGIYSMVLSGGGYNMQNLPGDQQTKRYYDYAAINTRVHRTIPFVNSHDTYRPKLDANGNFLKSLGDGTGWDTGNELGGNGQHIDPREPRLYAAYAAAFAMDGNPLIYFEDLFDLGTTSKRWTHLPTSETDLPIREDLKNILQAHQKLSFKDGDYAVPTALGGGSAPTYAAGSSGDHLVIERKGKALIGVTDAYSSASNNTADQQVWVSVGDPTWYGKVLYDYSGAHGVTTTTVFNDGRVLIKTAPAGHNISGARGHGYSIWAPAPIGVTFSTVQDIYNYLATYAPSRSVQTTQEWEMADDLGDSHCQSLGQGGALPTNATNERVAGKIFVAAGTTINYTLTPEVDGRNINISLYGTDGLLLSSASGAATIASPLTGSYNVTADGWVAVKVRNSDEITTGQKCWARVTYTAPTTVNTRSGIGVLPSNVSIWTGNKGTNSVTDCGNWEGGLIPGTTSHVIVYGHAKPFPVLTTDMTVNKVTLFTGATFTVNTGVKLTILSQ